VEKVDRLSNFGYFDCLSDVLPTSVIDVMHRAVAKATHHGTGRDGEPWVMAGVRALLTHVLLTDDAERRADELRGHFRVLAESERESAKKQVDDNLRANREDLVRLAAVRQLVDVRRKTLRMDALATALSTCGEIGTEATAEADDQHAERGDLS
jgi:hypothetical protein